MYPLARGSWQFGLTLALGLVVAGPASAQQGFDWDTNGSFTISYTPPDLNQSSCNALASTFFADLIPNAALPTSSGQDLYIYWVNSSGGSCEGALPSGDDLIARQTLEINDPLVNGGTFQFPEDTNDGAFTYSDILVDHFPDACEETGLTNTSNRICFAINNTSAIGGDNAAIDVTDVYGWILVTADTRAPPTPSAPTVVALDSQVRLTASVTGSESDDVSRWEGRIRPLADGETLPTNEPCDTWSDFTSGTNNSATSTGTVSITATNDVTYEGCMLAFDTVDNQSPASASVAATPREECDYFECLPVQEAPGFCTTGVEPFWPLLLTTVVVWRRRRREAT